MPARERLDVADAAFIGRLTAVREAELREGTPHRAYVFLVDGVIKGDLPREVEVLSPANSAACGFSLERNAATGILLRREGDVWLGGVCGQIAVGELVAASEEREQRLVNWGGLVVGTLVLLLGGWLTWRRLKRRRAALAALGERRVPSP